MPEASRAFVLSLCLSLVTIDLGVAEGWSSDGVGGTCPTPCYQNPPPQPPEFGYPIYGAPPPPPGTSVSPSYQTPPPSVGCPPVPPGCCNYPPPTEYPTYANPPPYPYGLVPEGSSSTALHSLIPMLSLVAFYATFLF